MGFCLLLGRGRGYFHAFQEAGGVSSPLALFSPGFTMLMSAAKVPSEQADLVPSLAGLSGTALSTVPSAFSNRICGLLTSPVTGRCKVLGNPRATPCPQPQSLYFLQFSVVHNKTDFDFYISDTGVYGLGDYKVRKGRGVGINPQTSMVMWIAVSPV